MNNPQRANAVASTIGTIKWVLIGLIGLGVLIGFIGGIATADDGGLAVAFAALIGGAIYALMTWVFFGWLEHTLKMLVNISNNTAGAPMPGGYNPGPSAPPAPPAGY